MIVEGVSFNENLVRKMKKREFVSTHKSLFFKDRTMEEREDMLSAIYDKIKGGDGKQSFQ